MLAGSYKSYFDESVNALFRKTSDYPGAFQQQKSIYAYKQQCLIGNVNTPAPDPNLEIMDRKLWDAWSELNGSFRTDAC